MSEQNNSDVILRSISKEVVLLRKSMQELVPLVSKIAESLAQLHELPQVAKRQHYYPLFDQNVEVLATSTRAHKCLTNAGIATVLELVQQNETLMLQSKHFGPKVIKEIKVVLKDFNLRLGMTMQDIYDWPFKGG